MAKKCEVHKRYRGIRRPRSNCKTCLAIYQEYHQLTSEQIDADKTIMRASDELNVVRRKYKRLLEENEALVENQSRILAIKSQVGPIAVKPSQPSESSEAVAVIVASDWHFEEEVDPETINNLNSFNLAIAEKRADYFFQNSLRLIRLCQRDIRIDTVILALLGDFVSNDIHDELMETNQLQPMHAILKAQNILLGGIEFFLKHTKCNFIIPCCSGNHARTTPKSRHSTEAGHSLEYFMYCNLANYFAGNKRVQFRVSIGHHTYIDVFNLTLRFHHGHGIRYQGGVGGITIPLNKAIAQWNKAMRADLDVVGHWHQFRDTGNAIINGSLIGYNAYALSIKADFERPRQAFFLLDKKRGKTIVAPVLLESN